MSSTDASPVDPPLHCVNCDYSLQGLPDDGVCPECGTPVAATRASYLEHADPLWVIRLADGALLDMWWSGLSLFVLGAGLLSRFFSTNDIDLRNFNVNRAAMLLGLVATFMLTAKPKDERPGNRAMVRLALRIVSVAEAIVWHYGFLISVWLGSPTPVGLLSLALYLATTLLFYFHLRNLGRFVPDPYIMRHAIWVMIAMLAGTVNRLVEWLIYFVDLTGHRLPDFPPLIGPAATIVAIVWNVVLMQHCRTIFQAAAEKARDGWPTSAIRP